MTPPPGSVATRPTLTAGAPGRRSTALRASRAAVGFYLLARAWQLVTLGHPVVTADTPMYRYAGQRWLDFPGGNFAGHALRPWPITLLYSVAPTDTWRVLAQFAIATCCWAFCIWQFGRLTSNRTAAAIASFAVAVLALSLGISGFDAVLLSESLTLSLVALYVGTLLSVCRGRGRLPTLATALVVAALLALLRPVLLPLAPGVALVAYLVRLRPRRIRRGRAAATVVVFAVLSAGAMAYGWTSNVAIDKTWGDWLSVPGLNGRTLTQYYLAAYKTPSGPSVVEAMVDAGAPPCLRPNPPATARDRRDFFHEDRLACPQGQAWLSDHFVTTLAVHLATHPGAARRYFADALGDESVLRTDGQPAMAVLVPSPVAEVFFSGHRGFGDPLVLWSVVAAGLVGGFLVQVRRRNGRAPDPSGGGRRRAGRRLLRSCTPLQVAMACTAVAGYAALGGTALLSATDASRVALPVTLLIRLVLVVVIVRTTVAIVGLSRAGSPVGAAHADAATGPANAHPVPAAHLPPAAVGEPTQRLRPATTPR